MLALCFLAFSASPVRGQGNLTFAADDGVVGTSNADFSLGGTGRNVVYVATDVFGSDAIVVQAAGATSFEGKFTLAFGIATNVNRLFRMSLSEGTFAAGSFANMGIEDISAGPALLAGSDVAKISGGVGTDFVLMEITTAGAAAAAGDIIGIDFIVDNLAALSGRDKQVQVTAKLALANDVLLADPLQQEVSTVVQSVVGANTLFVQGTDIAISGASRFTEFTPNGAAPTATGSTVAFLGTVRLRSNDGTSVGRLANNGGDYVAATPIDGAGGRSTLTISSPMINSTNPSLTEVCMDINASGDCNLGDAFATIDFAAGTATFEDQNGVGTANFNAAAIAAATPVFLEVDGETTIDSGTVRAEFSAQNLTGSTNKTFDGGAIETAFVNITQEGLRTLLGPVLSSSFAPAFQSVVRVTNTATFVENVTMTLREQSTGDIICSGLVASDVPPSSAIQLLISEVEETVCDEGFTAPSTSYLVEVFAGFDGKAAALMLSNGVFSNVSGTESN